MDIKQKNETEQNNKPASVSVPVASHGGVWGLVWTRGVSEWLNTPHLVRHTSEASAELPGELVLGWGVRWD